MALLSEASPAVTLTWNDQFDSSSTPTEFRLFIRTMGTSETRFLSPAAVMSAFGTSDYVYIVGNLTYTDYSFALVAVYNITGMTALSEESTLNHTVQEGSKCI